MRLYFILLLGLLRRVLRSRDDGMRLYFILLLGLLRRVLRSRVQGDPASIPNCAS